MSLIHHHRFHQNWIHHFGFMILFPRIPFIGLFKRVKLYGMPRVTGSSSESDIQTTKIKVRALFGSSSGIPFGSLYPKIWQVSAGVIFKDEFWKTLEP